jgi:hypothetical protein
MLFVELLDVPHCITERRKESNSSRFVEELNQIFHLFLALTIPFSHLIDVIPDRLTASLFHPHVEGQFPVSENAIAVSQNYLIHYHFLCLII